MKKAVFLLFLASLFGYAQPKDTIGGRHVNHDWIQQVRPLFNKLDMSKVPHGLLLDRAMEFTNVAAYDGKLSDSTLVNVTELGNIFKTLAMAQVGDSTTMPQMEDWAKMWAHNRVTYNMEKQETLVLSGLIFKYARIIPDALEQKKIAVVDGHYEESYENGVWQNPYEEMLTMAIAPPINRYNKREFFVVLPKSLWIKNTELEKIEVDFNDDKGFRTLDMDQPLRVSYHKADETKYLWTFRITLANGHEMLSQTAVIIFEPEAEPQSGLTNVFISHNGEQAWHNKGAILRINYAPSHNGQLVKPLIVAEGFDPGSILSPETEGGDRTLTGNDGFLASIVTAGQLPFLLAFNTPMREYDIVYVDWQNGTNDIRHNSQVLKNVIDWVNEHKQGSEKNVVLGQSMGGLVGRYTLAKMEQDGLNHQVRLFIAHDSPLQGANTPLSTQYFTRHIYDEYIDSGTLSALGEYIVPVIFNVADMMSAVINAMGGNTSVDTYISPETFLTIGDTPAAVQMNYHYVDGMGNEQKVFHQIWQQQFDAMGYPQECRNIAISNGNECAVDHGFEARDKFLSFHKNSGNPNLLSDLILQVATPLLGVAIDNYALVLVGLLPGSSKYFYDFDLHSNPKLNDSERHVYNGKIRYRKKFLWLVPIWVTLMSRNNDAPEEYEPFDIYSGGFYDISIVVEQIAETLPVSITDDVYVNQRYDFIPVVSALDIRRDGNVAHESDFYRKYAGGAPIPAGLTTEFENFIVGYTPAVGDNPVIFTNYPHISFQARNGNWLANELNEQPTGENCNFICENDAIHGPDFFCDSATFNVMPGADVYNWSYFSGDVVSGTVTNNVLTLTQVDNNSGWVTVNVHISSDDCGEVFLTKRVYVGSPTVKDIELIDENEPIHHYSLSPIDNETTGCGNIGLKLNFYPSNYGIEEIEWEKITTNVGWDRDYASYNDRYAYLHPTCNTTFEFKVRMRNSCGWSDWQTLAYEIEDCNNDCSTGTGGPSTSQLEGQYYTLYPVPADTQLTVKINNEEDFTMLTPSYNVKIYDPMYNLVIDVNKNMTPGSIDISNLNPDLYFVIITRNGVSESFQIMIN
jgi:hypothetical protein